MINTTKAEIQKLIKRLETGEFGQSFKLRKSKNARGDYGVDETYFTSEGLALWTISFDGARSDTRYFVNPNLI